MRTEPRADEVRNIVEDVFSRYLCQCRVQASGSPGGLRGYENSQAECLRHEESQAGRLGYERETFPRLYEPERFAPAEEDNNPVLPEIDETILIDQGRYVARSYRTEGYMAMWLVAVGIVQFYDDTGRMLATINLFESLRPQRMAA